MTTNRPTAAGGRFRLNGFLYVLFFDMVNMLMLVHNFIGFKLNILISRN
jgi:hypothetical protein